MLSCRRRLLLLVAAAAAAADQAAAFVVPQGTQMLSGVSTLAKSQGAVRPVAAAATTATAAAATSSSSSSSSKHTLEGEEIEGQLQPLRGMVLLQKLDEENKTPGGLLLAKDSRREQLVGRVLASGPGEYQPETGKRIAADVKEGDLVVFSKHAGESLKYDGAECVLLTGSDILAKLAKPEGLQKSDVQPLADTVFVRILKPADRTKSGLLLMPQQQERLLQQAEVVAVGPGRLNKNLERNPVEVSVGDRVLYSTYAEETAQLKIGEEVYGFVRAAEIAAKW